MSMNVFLTNDDGINARGLRELYKALKNRGHKVFAVAPARQQSGVSHSLTVFEPLRVAREAEDEFQGVGVYGTPVDCVKLGLGVLSDFKPDLVMSGINSGPNAGPDIFYSGTIAAAAEGANAGIPAMAISYGDPSENADMESVARKAVELAERIVWEKIRDRVVINVNFPACETGRWAGIKVCSQSASVWDNSYIEKRDPRGEPYWWLDGKLDPPIHGKDTDRHFLANNYISVTPLKFDYTAKEYLNALADMGLEEE